MTPSSLLVSGWFCVAIFNRVDFFVCFRTGDFQRAFSSVLCWDRTDRVRTHMINDKT